MPSLRDIKRRIQSVKNTQQITRAMKLIAAAKVKRAVDHVHSARPYSDKIGEMTRRVMGTIQAGTHPLVSDRPENKALFILVSSDKGLCGGFNSNLFREITRFMCGRHSVKFDFLTVGKKGRDFFRGQKVNIVKSMTDVFRKINRADAVEVGTHALDAYMNGGYDAVYICYNRFRSMVSQVPTIEKLLPISSGEQAGESAEGKDNRIYTYEPEQESLLDSLVKAYVDAMVLRSLLESNAGEHAARMTAMDSATKNAKDMISLLTLTYNRARQAYITKELIEVVSGADALVD